MTELDDKLVTEIDEKIEEYGMAGVYSDAIAVKLRFSGHYNKSDAQMFIECIFIDSASRMPISRVILPLPVIETFKSQLEIALADIKQKSNIKPNDDVR